MRMALRKGKIFVPRPPTTRRRRDAASLTCAQENDKNGDTRSASLPAIDPSLPEKAIHIPDNICTIMECRTMRAICRRGVVGPAAVDTILYNFNRRDRVWSCGWDKCARCNEIRKASIPQGVTAFRRFVDIVLVIALVCLLGYLLAGGPVRLEWLGSIGTASFTQLAHWGSFLMVDPSRGGYASQTKECYTKSRLRSFAGTGSMIPLAIQLSRRVIPSTPSAVFEVQKDSPGRDDISDLEAVAELQRDWPWPADSDTTEGPTATYTVATKAHNGERDNAAARLFPSTHSGKLEKSRKAMELLQSLGEPETNASNASPDERRTGGTKEKERLPYSGAETEHETTQRYLEISRMMREASNVEQDLLPRCSTYFSDVHRRVIL